MNIGDKVNHRFSDRTAVIVDVFEGVNKLIVVEWIVDKYQVALPPSDFKIVRSEK